MKNKTYTGLMIIRDILDNILGHEDVPSCTSGMPGLDAVSNGGWHPGELIVLAGEPGIGKTSLALNFASTAAQKGTKTLYLSTEMNSEQLIKNLISQASYADSPDTAVTTQDILTKKDEVTKDRLHKLLLPIMDNLRRKETGNHQQSLIWQRDYDYPPLVIRQNCHITN